MVSQPPTTDLQPLYNYTWLVDFILVPIRGRSSSERNAASSLLASLFASLFCLLCFFFCQYRDRSLERCESIRACCICPYLTRIPALAGGRHWDTHEESSSKLLVS